MPAKRKGKGKARAAGYLTSPNAHSVEAEASTSTALGEGEQSSEKEGEGGERAGVDSAMALRRSTRRKNSKDDVPGEVGPSKRRRVEQVISCNEQDETTAEEEPPAVPIQDIHSPIDYRGLPHIFDDIFSRLLDGWDDDNAGVYHTLLSFRASCKELQMRVDTLLFDHVLVSGKLPKGLSSRYGRIPSMCDANSLGRKRSEYSKLVSERSIRVCDFTGVDSFNTSWYQQFKNDFFKVVGGMHHVQTFRHRDRFDLPYGSIPLKPSKVVRFLDVTKTWQARRDSTESMGLPESVQTLVVNMKYTNNWNSWTEFFDFMTSKSVSKLVLIFEPVDGDEAIPDAMPWRSRPFGILAPIIQKLVWELQFNHILFDITIVGLPHISLPWTGLRFTLAEVRTFDQFKINLLDRFRSHLQETPLMPMDGTALTDNEVDELFSKIKFVDRAEYVATLPHSEYVEHFCWYAPLEDDGESLL